MTLHLPTALRTARGTDPFALTTALRTTALGVANRAALTLASERIHHHIDQVRAGLPGPVTAGRYDTLAAQTLAILRQEITDATNDQVRRHPPHDLGVCVTFLPDVTDPGRLLAIVTAEMSAYHDAFTALPGVEDYSWYSCEHPPVPEHEWAARHAAWTASLRDGRFSDLGLRWNLFSLPGPISVPALREVNIPALAAAAPSKQDRALNLAGRMSDGALTYDLKTGFSLREYEAAIVENLPAATAYIAPITDADWTTPLLPAT